MTGSQSNNGEDGDTQVTFWEAIAPNCSSVYVQTEADTVSCFSRTLIIIIVLSTFCGSVKLLYSTRFREDSLNVLNWKKKVFPLRYSRWLLGDLNLWK